MVLEGFQRGLKPFEPCGFRGFQRGLKPCGFGFSGGSETVGGLKGFRGVETLGENARNVCIICFESYRGSKCEFSWQKSALTTCFATYVRSHENR